MFKTKELVFATLLCSVSAIFQLIPSFFSHALIFFTIVSSFPIYLITKKDYKLGLLSYIVTAIVIMLFNTHESMMFVFTNGLIGVTLGFLDKILTNKFFVCFMASLYLSMSLIVINYLIGIPIIGISLNIVILELLIIVLISVIYICVYYSLIKYLSKKVKIFRDYLNNI